MTGDRGTADRWVGADTALVALALVVRLVWAFMASTELWFDHVFNDATAQSLAAGRGFTVSETEPFDPAIFRTPGYPAFLALVYTITGASVRAAFVANALLGTASCVLLRRVAGHRLGTSVGRWTLLVAATYPFTIFFVGQLSPECLLVFLGLVLVALVDRLPDSGGYGRLIATGVVAAALAWIKPVFLPLPAFLFLVELYRARGLRTALVRATIVGLTIVAGFGPWVARNVAEFDRPVLAGELGLVVWHGTLDFADERDEMILENFEAQPKDPAERYDATRGRFADSHAMLARDGEFLERGLANVREHPVKAFVVHPLMRIPRVWISTTYTGGPAWVGTGAMIGCILYLLLGVYALLKLGPARRRELAAWWMLPLMLTLVYAALHAEARYTLPARPSLLLLVGWALDYVARGVRQRTRG